MLKIIISSLIVLCRAKHQTRFYPENVRSVIFFYIDVRVMFNHVNQLVKLLAKICEPYIIVNIEGIPISNTKCNRLEARQSEYTDLLKKVQSLLRTHLGSRNNILRISGRKQPQSISGWFRRGELWGEHLNLRPVRKTRFKIIILLVIWC